MYLKLSALFLAIVTVGAFGYLYRVNSANYPLSRAFSANAIGALLDTSADALSLDLKVNGKTAVQPVGFNDVLTVSWNVSSKDASCVPEGTHMPKTTGGYWDEGTLTGSGEVTLFAREGMDRHVETLQLSLVCHLGEARASASLVVPIVAGSDTMLLFGGYQKSSNAFQNNLLVSTDGTNWTPLASDLSKDGRSGHSMIYFNNNYWIFGGVVEKAKGERVVTNDVLMSPDGVSWVTMAKAPWSPRSGLAVAVLDKTLYLYGGMSTAATNKETKTTYYGDVWSTTNGVNWTKVAGEATIGARTGHAMTSFQNKLWVYGGMNAKGLLGDLHYSLDGATWNRVALPEKIVPRYGHSLVGFGNELYLMGGQTDKEFSNTVWRATGGMDWKRVAVAEWQPRAWAQTFVANGKLFIVGGRNASQDFTDVWTSEDGISWNNMQNLIGDTFGPVGFGAAVKGFKFGR